MSFLSRFKLPRIKLPDFLSSPGDRNILTPPQGEDPGERDRRAAISALSRAVRNDPDSVEIYLALGNLYRAQGDIERAVQLRSTLIARPSLEDRLKARVYFELGHDYKRGGFIDRALQAFEQARRLSGESDEITRDTARLHAESGNFLQAATLFGRLGMRIPQAHYLVRHAQEVMQSHGEAEARKFLSKALKANQSSIEARQELIGLAARNEDWRATRKRLDEALKTVPADLRFLLLENLLQLSPSGSSTATRTEDFRVQLCKAVLPVLEAQSPDLLLQYYGALYLLRCNDTETANAWLAKTMVLSPDFWAARLALLDIAMKEQQLSPVFKSQLEFFIEQAHHVKKFVCRACGLHRKTTFYRCPRCRSWHSIAFRTSLQD
ncbi:tetratricopeptide repeat protein [Oleidesulfovibrio alaskensis]|uniref:tetratricopeptide repeat protein n=1 Tax=Oleidesulfovibrio alaskensis TaxID=58180 RepID=UPI0003F7657F|nr:tetratricopeptide repeat protein [Oleidesulfovibrio alaskensis]MBL3582652.1 tetratricopeptide repeat protein [Oleidesulfovibrio alaskensis]